MSRPLAPCGSESAHTRHVRLKEPVDEACRAARVRHNAERNVPPYVKARHKADAAAYHRAQRRLREENADRFAQLYADEKKADR